jgi:transposase
MSQVKRKVYSKEFKENAVKMVLQEGRKASEVARDLDIQENMLYLWKRKYLEDEQELFPGKGNLKDRDANIRQLERENKRLKDERDILKKAAIFFAQEK